MPFRGTTQHRREREREEQDQDQEEGSARRRRRRRRDGQGKKEAIDGKKGKENGEKKEREKGGERDDQECTAGKLTIGGRNVAETDDVFGNTTRLFTLNTKRHPSLGSTSNISTLSIP